MYSDRDGTASKQSQIAYDRQMRLLRLATGVLSSIGFAVEIVHGECIRTMSESLMGSSWNVDWHHAGPALWVGLIADAGPIAQDWFKLELLLRLY